MALFTIENTRIAGVSACVPEKVISNHDYTWISEKDRKLLIKTTGVENKHVVGSNTTASDLCYVATERLIEQLKWKKMRLRF
ncbi:MAG: hypothetical protein R2764_13850 [Bacteroidales bacterium]